VETYELVFFLHLLKKAGIGFYNAFIQNSYQFLKRRKEDVGNVYNVNTAPIREIHSWAPSMEILDQLFIDQSQLFNGVKCTRTPRLLRDLTFVFTGNHHSPPLGNYLENPKEHY